MRPQQPRCGCGVSESRTIGALLAASRIVELGKRKETLRPRRQQRQFPDLYAVRPIRAWEPNISHNARLILKLEPGLGPLCLAFFCLVIAAVKERRYQCVYRLHVLSLSMSRWHNRDGLSNVQQRTTTRLCSCLPCRLCHRLSHRFPSAIRERYSLNARQRQARKERKRQADMAGARRRRVPTEAGVPKVLARSSPRP